MIENIQKRSQDASMFHRNSHLMPDDRRNSSGSNYGDPFQNIHVEMTKATDIEDFLKQGQMTDILLMEKFIHLPKNDLYQSEAGKKEENVHLNRSILFLPYDKNRVQLPVTDSSATDYINASFVKVFKTRTYIVTEAPTTVTAQRFWSMVWHSNVERIVMLVDLEEITEPPCELYWNDETPQKYGDVKVSVVSLKRFANYTVRLMEVTHLNSKTELVRSVHHYQYKK